MRGVTEVTIDGALIVTAALLMIARFVFEPLFAGPPIESGDLTVIVLAQFGAVSSCLFAGLLVLWGDPVLPGRPYGPRTGRRGGGVPGGDGPDGDGRRSLASRPG